MSPFDEDEIDGLVSEVEDIESIPAAPRAEEGAWMGVPEGTDEPGFANDAATFGSSVPLADLLNDESTAPIAASAPHASWTPRAPGGAADFEIDRGFDPEWARPEEREPTPAFERASAERPVAPTPAAPKRSSVPADDLVPIAPFPLPEPDLPADAASDRDLRLTEVASDEDLFMDPSLEIAQLAAGEAREIVVPVILGFGPDAKRYKLAIRLRLDAVD
jgi:hypothetical protein